MANEKFYIVSGLAPHYYPKKIIQAPSPVIACRRASNLGLHSDKRFRRFINFGMLEGYDTEELAKADLLIIQNIKPRPYV